MAKPSASLLDQLRALIREKAALTYGAQRALAQLVGVSAQRLSDYLAGRHEPGGDVTLQLAAWAGVLNGILKVPKPTSAPRVAGRPGRKPGKGKSKPAPKKKAKPSRRRK